MPWSDYTETAAATRGREDALGRTLERLGPDELVDSVDLPPYPPAGCLSAPGYLEQARAAAAGEVARIEAAWLGLAGDLEQQLLGLRGDRRDLPRREEIDRNRRIPAGLNFFVYLCIALIAGAAEFVMLYQVFQVAGKESNLLMSLLLPAGLAVALPVAAHFVGEDWRTVEARVSRPGERSAARRRMLLVITVIAAAQVGIALFRFVKFGGKLRQTTTMAGLVVPSWVWMLTFLAFQAVLFLIMALAARKLPSAGQSHRRAIVKAVDALEQRATALGRQWETGYQARRGEAQQVIARLDEVYAAYWGANNAARTDPFSPVIVPDDLSLPTTLESTDPPEFSTDLEVGLRDPSPQPPQAAAAQPVATSSAQTATPAVPVTPSSGSTGQQPDGQEELAPEIT